MIQVTIKNENAHSVFHSMIEGMHELARDDNDVQAAQHLNMLLDATSGASAYPATYNIPDACVLALDDVIENLYTGDDEEFENSDVVKSASRGIEKPKWTKIEEVLDLGKVDDIALDYAGTRGVVLHAERSKVYAYMAEIDGKIKYVVPLGNCETAFDTVEQVAAFPDLMEFAVGEGMFPSFKTSLVTALREAIELVEIELMSDRESGDITPQQSHVENDGIEEIADVLIAVWLQNRAKA